MRYWLTLCLLAVTFSLGAQKKRITTLEYIEKYKAIAIDEMNRSGIPASITLAQGIVESGSGNSTLAREANNHFGIKCHNWAGEKYYKDDDSKNECFRKYALAEDSYRDHSDFLMKAKRYSFLFEYKSNDYKSWAYGLKKAGYATNPKYPEDLIRTIETNNLQQYDLTELAGTNILKKKNSSEIFQIELKSRQIYEKNRIKYVVVGKNDNIVSITKELDLFSWQIAKYNDLPDGYQPKEGEILYIQPKRWRAESGNDFHLVKEGENMRSISQLYGIKLKKLYRKNRMEPGTEPAAGTKLWLRSRKPAN